MITDFWPHKKRRVLKHSLHSPPSQISRHALNEMTATRTLSSSRRNRSCRESHGFGGSRIPESLKLVFLQSNQGHEVHEPPQDKAAFKVFERKKRVDLKKDSPELGLPLGKSWHLHQPGDPLGSCSNHSDGSWERKGRKYLKGGLYDVLKMPKVKSSEEKSNIGDLASEACALSETDKSESVSKPVASYPSQRYPQVFLDVMLRTLGYSTHQFNTLETSYCKDPTTLQVASYHTRLQDLALSKQEDKLRGIMSSGISTNPCNRHGDSLLHTACRSGWDACLRLMIDCGTSVQVSDGVGRTPLHSAFFGTNLSFEIVDLLIKKDRHLLHLRDRLGATPLAYIPRDQWGIWIDYFYSKRDQFWPRRNKRIDGVEQPPQKMHEAPNSKPLLDPSNALIPEMAAMVVAGKLTPEEAQCLMNDDDDYTGDNETITESTWAESTYEDSTYQESLEDYERMSDDFDGFHCGTIEEE